MLDVTSTAFKDHEVIPAKYCATGVAGGKNISPQLSWEARPPGTRTFVVAIVDHHPIARRWVHWVVTGIPASITSLAENVSGRVPAPAWELQNTGGHAGYGGPRPPIGSGDHEYVVTVYALDIDDPKLGDEPDAGDIAHAVTGHVLDSGTITGVFGR